MPKLKPTELELQNRRTRAAIEHNKKLHAIEDKDIAKALGVTIRTVQNKENRPETMSMHDIRMFCKILKFTDDQIAELVGMKG